MAATSAETITLSNWRTSPNSEHAFVNIDQLIKTQTIKASTQRATAFNKSTINLDTFKAKLGEQTLDLPAFLDSTNTDGFLVLHKGMLVHGYYAHGNDASSKHIMMSMSKSVTGLVTGVLVEQGVLDAEAEVVQYLPEVKGTPYEHVTVRNLLDMRSGVQYSDDSHEYRFATGWELPNDGEEATDFLKFISNFHAPANEPGGPFEYLSVNTDVLGLVIQRASGKKLADLIQEHIWQPISAESDALLTVDAAGNPRAAGGMCATVRDLARLGQGILSGKIVSRTWLEDTLTRGDTSLIASSTFGPFAQIMGGDMAYRNCWLVDGEAEVLFALGVHGQTLVVDLKNEIVMVKTSSQPHPVSRIGTAIVGFKEIRKIVLA